MGGGGGGEGNDVEERGFSLRVEDVKTSKGDRVGTAGAISTISSPILVALWVIFKSGCNGRVGFSAMNSKIHVVLRIKLERDGQDLVFMGSSFTHSSQLCPLLALVGPLLSSDRGVGPPGASLLRSKG